MRPSKYRTCAICARPTVSPWSPYCTRCRPLIVGHRSASQRRAALREAHDSDLDAFRCRYSRAPLEEEYQDSPFYLVFDHESPPRTSRLVACAAVFNVMKGQMTPDEFQRAVRELAAHHRGKPFDRGAVTIHYWTQRMPPRPGDRLHAGERAMAAYSDCVVCGNTTFKYSIYCPRCRWYVNWHGPWQPRYARALREAYDAAMDGFVCQYTGVRLDEEMGRPWSLNFDHVVPGDDIAFAVAAWWVNYMKTDLAVDEFWTVVGELDACRREGREFDRDICEFRYWRRTSGNSGCF